MKCFFTSLVDYYAFSVSGSSEQKLGKACYDVSSSKKTKQSVVLKMSNTLLATVSVISLHSKYHNFSDHAPTVLYVKTEECKQALYDSVNDSCYHGQ